jgi:hypothetical protein
MSYDVQVWSVRAFEPQFLRQPDRWQDTSGQGHWNLVTTNWQIVINRSAKVLPEDVEDEISGLLPGIAWRTEINLEGKATAEAARLLRQTAKEIAKGAHGVIVDPQTDKISTPAGVARFIPPKKQESFSVLRLSWWFLGDVLLSRAGRESFLSLLERWLPEAMPKRYGDYEPPQFVYSETGKGHLLAMKEKNLHLTMVWYPHRPVIGVDADCPKPLGASVQGFRTHLVDIEIETAALSQPGWPDNLRLFWRQMAKLLRPIYADVRTYGGRVRHGAAVYLLPDALNQDDEITRGWFWRGIPLRLGHAVVLGEEYQRLWPEFVAKASLEDGLAFASTPDWSTAEDLTEYVDRVPKQLALQPLAPQVIGFRPLSNPPRQKYPEVWPFGPPFL